jgi:MFS family permease
VQHSYEALDREGGFGGGNIFGPLRHRDFRLLWLGMTVSLLGDGIFLVAMAWQVYALSNAPTALSIVGIAMTLPQIVFLLVGGAISDRFDRRLVMLVADVVRGTAIALLAALAISGALELVEMVAIVAVYGAATAFFSPAFDAIVPEVLPSAELARANSLDQFIRPVALRMVGPALGGVLVAALGPGSAFALDALSFALSGAALLAMRALPPASGPAREGVVGEIRAGFGYVRAHVWLWGTFLSATIAYLAFMGPAEVLLPYVVKNDLHAGAGQLGIVFAAGGVGSLGCAIWMGHRELPRKEITFMFVTWTLATLAVVGYGLARAPWQLMVASLAFNSLETAGTIVWATLKQRNVPSELLGRVSSLDWLISIGLVPLSFALTGPVSAAIGARQTLIAAGLVGAAATFSALFLPGMRDLEREPAVVEQPAT